MQRYSARVGGLKEHSGETDVARAFSKCGRLLRVALPRRPHGGAHGGFCVVQFADQASLDFALGLHGSLLGGAALSVRKALRADLEWLEKADAQAQTQPPEREQQEQEEDSGAPVHSLGPQARLLAMMMKLERMEGSPRDQPDQPSCPPPPPLRLPASPLQPPPRPPQRQPSPPPRRSRSASYPSRSRRSRRSRSRKHAHRHKRRHRKERHKRSSSRSRPRRERSPSPSPQPAPPPAVAAPPPSRSRSVEFISHTRPPKPSDRRPSLHSSLTTALYDRGENLARLAALRSSLLGNMHVHGRQQSPPS